MISYHSYSVDGSQLHKNSPSKVDTLSDFSKYEDRYSSRKKEVVNSKKYNLPVTFLQELNKSILNVCYSISSLNNAQKQKSVIYRLKFKRKHKQTLERT